MIDNGCCQREQMTFNTTIDHFCENKFQLTLTTLCMISGYLPEHYIRQNSNAELQTDVKFSVKISHSSRAY
jgi:hypothetical protein